MWSELKDLPEYWSFFQRLASSQPVIAIGLGAVLVGLLWFLAVRQSRIFLIEQRSQIKSHALGFFVAGIVCLAVSAFVVTLLKYDGAPRPRLSAQPHAIGRLNLKWEFDHPQTRGHVLFEVQSAPDKRFLDVAQEALTPFRTFNLPSSKSHGARYWRVRAVETWFEPDMRGGSKPMSSMSEWSAPARIEFYNTALDRIRNTGVVRVYFSDTLDDGWFLYSTEEGKVSGFDYRLAEKLVQELGKRLWPEKQLRFDARSAPWTRLLEQPASGNADMVVSMISATRERESRYNIDFTNKYYASTQTLLASMDNCTVRYGSAEHALRAAARSGFTVGTHAETTSAALLRLIAGVLPAMRVEEVQDSSLVEQRLLNGAAGGWRFAIADSPLAEAIALTGKGCATRLTVTWNDLIRLGVPKASVRAIQENFYTPGGNTGAITEQYAIAVRSGEHWLRSTLNEILRELDTPAAPTKVSPLALFQEESRRVWDRLVKRSEHAVPTDGR